MKFWNKHLISSVLLSVIAAVAVASLFGGKGDIVLKSQPTKENVANVRLYGK